MRIKKESHKFFLTAPLFKEEWVWPEHGKIYAVEVGDYKKEGRKEKKKNVSKVIFDV